MAPGRPSSRHPKWLFPCLFSYCSRAAFPLAPLGILSHAGLARSFPQKPLDPFFFFFFPSVLSSLSLSSLFSPLSLRTLIPAQSLSLSLSLFPSLPQSTPASCISLSFCVRCSFLLFSDVFDFFFVHFIILFYFIFVPSPRAEPRLPNPEPPLQLVLPVHFFNHQNTLPLFSHSTWSFLLRTLFLFFSFLFFAFGFFFFFFCRLSTRRNGVQKKKRILLLFDVTATRVINPHPRLSSLFLSPPTHPPSPYTIHNQRKGRVKKLGSSGS